MTNTEWFEEEEPSAEDREAVLVEQDELDMQSEIDDLNDFLGTQPKKATS